MPFPPIYAVARIAVLDAVRRPAFWAGGGLFSAAAALVALPVSSGVPADPGHYREAALSTLLLGAVLLPLMIVPVLLASGRENGTRESLFALPLGRGTFVLGVFSGFLAAMTLFLVLGGSCAFFASGTHVSDEWEPWTSGLAWNLLVSAFSTALLLCTSRFFSYTPSLALAGLILVMGHLSFILPTPLCFVLPCLGAGGSFLEGGGGPAQVGLYTGFCLSLASLGPPGGE